MREGESVRERSGSQLLSDVQTFFYSPFTFQVLKDGGVTSGGVMIFLTDGKQSCNGECKDGISCVINDIVEAGVRVVTIAFG